MSPRLHNRRAVAGSIVARPSLMNEHDPRRSSPSPASPMRARPDFATLEFRRHHGSLETALSAAARATFKSNCESTVTSTS
jgi:hypothetical protein